MSESSETSLTAEVGDEQGVKMTEPSHIHEKEEGDEQGAGDFEITKITEEVTQFLEEVIDNVILILEKKFAPLTNSLPSEDAKQNQSERADDETGEDYREAQDTILGDIPVEIFEKDEVVPLQGPKKQQKHREEEEERSQENFTVLRSL